MFQCSDQVLYGMHGVCEIVDIETKKIGNKATEYYVLEPVDQSNAKYYVPTQNKAAVAKMQHLLTRKELDDMLHSADMQDDAWIEDENQRKQHYCRLITSCDRAALVRMVHTIHKHKKQQVSTGRKLHLCDEAFLRDAERLLDSEFSLVLDIRHDEVGKYVQSILEANKKDN